MNSVVLCILAVVAAVGIAVHEVLYERRRLAKMANDVLRRSRL